VPAALGPEQPKIISGLHQKWVAASSPQAKGRVERVHGTHQDRLVKKLRLAAVSNYDAAPKMGIDRFWAQEQYFAVRVFRTGFGRPSG